MTRTRKGPDSLTESDTGAKKRHPYRGHGASRRQHQASWRAGKRPNNSRPSPPSTSWQQIGRPAGRVVARIWMEDAP